MESCEMVARVRTVSLTPGGVYNDIWRKWTQGVGKNPAR